MAEKPIHIKEVKASVNSTREELFAENSSKILGAKGFVFSTYKTDKQRAKEYAINHNIDEFFQKIRDLKIQNYQLMQPTMRFKPRTDLERICEVLGEFNIENKGKDIIFNQLSNVGLNVSKPVNRPKEDNEDEDKDKDFETHDDYDNDDYNNIVQNTNNSKSIPKQLHTEGNNQRSKYFQRKPPLKRIDNSEAKKIYPELYNKTYFKATENFPLFKNTCLLDSGQFNLQKNNKNQTKYNSTYYTHTNPNKRSVTRENESNNNRSSKIQNEEVNTPTDLIGILNICVSNSSSIKDKEMNLMKSLENIDLFTQSIKENKEKKEKFDGSKLSQIRDMAFISQDGNSNNYNDNKISIAKRKPGMVGKIRRSSYRENATTLNNPHQMYMSNGEDDQPNKVEEKIKINGEEYSKSAFDQISKKVLFNCNWIHGKNKMANEPLKARGGKLMCTGGLTVEEFEKKYKLQTIY